MPPHPRVVPMTPKKRETKIAENAPPEVRYAYQRLAREDTKRRLLADILVDMTICKMEHWDQMEYIRELQDLLNSFQQKETA